MTQVLWQPTNNYISTSNMYKFIQLVNSNYNKNFTKYSPLYNWSIEYPEDFWKILAKFCEIKFFQECQSVISTNENMFKIRWFEGAKLNFAENLLNKKDESIAIIYCDENMNKRYLSYNELYIAVASFAKSLLDRGIKPHDRVVGLISNIPEAVIAALATSSIGAIWSSCSPDFGITAIINRFEQIEPKILITQLEYQYNGKKYDIKNKLESIIKSIPSITTTILLDQENHVIKTNIELISYKDFLSYSDKINFFYGHFDHPLYILYSSGTTGKPKCIVHGSGGTLLQHSKELLLHTNININDKIFYYTSVSWMMWNWLISSLKIGATVVLYNGSPMHRKLDILFDLIDQEKISVFGVSAKYLSLLEQKKVFPIKTHKLTSLKTVLSTGSPLSEHSFTYVYKSIKKDVCLSSISGGSDIISCFGLGNPMKPVIKGEIQCIGLGMSVQVYDESGNAIKEKLGDLVCTKPFPSRPIYFWKDSDFSIYKKNYYKTFPNVWKHGDYAILTQNGGLKITGRSDTTLNPQGVRIGTAEIYQVLESIPFIIDSIIICKSTNDDVAIILFVVLQPENNITEDYIKIITNEIKHALSNKHIPQKIIQVKDIPRTFNDKKSEISVRNIFNDLPVTNTEALINPESLDEYKKIYDAVF
ncbi:MAG: acetoacetate--CoA ligase [Legionellales bacterium]|nr:acetoacetate--CoA ligase [Legionellales bacterium]